MTGALEPGRPYPSPPDFIDINGLSAHGFHGVFQHEKVDGQHFSADIRLWLDAATAALSDNLVDTADYGHICDQVFAVLTGPSRDLIETVADEIAFTLLEEALIGKVQVRVHKPQAPVATKVADISVTVVRTQEDRHDRLALRTSGALDRPPDPTRVILSLGSNCGESEHLLGQALTLLAEVTDVSVIDASRVVRSAAVGPVAQPDFRNAVCALETTLSPVELLAACQRIESALGRHRVTVWGPRPIDIDLIIFGGLKVDSARLSLPHPRAHQRAFVLVPWAQMDPQAVLAGRPVQDLLAEVGDQVVVVEGTDPLQPQPIVG